MRRLLIAILLTCLCNAQARGLAEILRNNLTNDPELLEAQANQMVSEAVLQQAEAQLYPTVRAVARQNTIGSNSKKFNPALEATWTVYDFGATKANIRYDKTQTEFYEEKVDETAGEVALQMANYYIEALRAKLSLEIAQKNLERHRKILSQIQIITQYDVGRRSEYTQAESRVLRVEENIVAYRRTLNLALRNLGRYVKPLVKINELEDPFINIGSMEMMRQFPLNRESILKHPSYRAQGKELASILAKLDAAKRSRYPSLVLNASASPSDTDLYLSVGADVFNKATDPKIFEFENQAKAAEARMRKIFENLSQRIDIAVLQMRQDEKRIEVAEKQIKAMEQVAIDYEDKFYIGAQSLLGVVDSYGDLANAEDVVIQAKYSLMQAKLDYLSASGRLTEWAGWKRKTKVSEDVMIDSNKPNEFIELYKQEGVKKEISQDISRSKDIKISTSPIIEMDKDGNIILK